MKILLYETQLDNVIYLLTANLMLVLVANLSGLIRTEADIGSYITLNLHITKIVPYLSARLRVTHKLLQIFI